MWCQDLLFTIEMMQYNRVVLYIVLQFEPLECLMHQLRRRHGITQ